MSFQELLIMARAVWCARVTIYHEVSRRSQTAASALAALIWIGHDVILAAQRSSFAELGGVSHANMSTILLKIRRIELLHPHVMLLPNLNLFLPTSLLLCPNLPVKLSESCTRSLSGSGSARKAREELPLALEAYRRGGGDRGLVMDVMVKKRKPPWILPSDLCVRQIAFLIISQINARGGVEISDSANHDVILFPVCEAVTRTVTLGTLYSKVLATALSDERRRHNLKIGDL